MLIDYLKTKTTFLIGLISLLISLIFFVWQSKIIIEQNKEDFLTKTNIYKERLSQRIDKIVLFQKETGNFVANNLNAENNTNNTKNKLSSHIIKNNYDSNQKFINYVKTSNIIKGSSSSSSSSSSSLSDNISIVNNDSSDIIKSVVFIDLLPINSQVLSRAPYISSEQYQKKQHILNKSVPLYKNNDYKFNLKTRYVYSSKENQLNPIGEELKLNEIEYALIQENIKKFLNQGLQKNIFLENKFNNSDLIKELNKNNSPTKMFSLLTPVIKRDANKDYIMGYIMVQIDASLLFNLNIKNFTDSGFIDPPTFDIKVLNETKGYFKNNIESISKDVSEISLHPDIIFNNNQFLLNNSAIKLLHVKFINFIEFKVDNLNTILVISKIPNIQILIFPLFMSVLLFMILITIQMFIFILYVSKVRVENKNEKNKKRIAYLTMFDEETGLQNKTSFNQELVTKINSATGFKKINKKFALIVWKLDGFRYIEDTLGSIGRQTCANKYSEEIKHRIKNNLYKFSDTEYALILEINEDREPKLAHNFSKILEITQSPFFLNNYLFNIDTSIGYCVFPRDGEEPVEILKNANLALLSAKKTGKNNFLLYDSKIREEIAYKEKIKSELERSLQTGENLYLLYQPKMSLISYKTVGIEALLRWNHPELGNIGPAKFISIAEENDLSYHIGIYVITEAVRLNKELALKGFDIPISVNISAKQLINVNLLYDLRIIAEEYRMTANSIKLEITEAFVIPNKSHTIELFEKLKKLGFAISLADFENGSCNLQNLKSLPIDEIKIDGLFTRNMRKGNSSYFIVESILNLSAKLNINVVAEGVESEFEFFLLKELNCPQIQGYYVSQPLTETEVFTKISQENNSTSNIDLII